MNPLAELVRRETEVLASFVALLVDEEQALVEANTEALATLTPRKTALVGELNTLAGRRNAAMQSAGLGEDAAGLERWRQSGPQAAAATERLLALASEARERNRVNGGLIALHLQKTQAALETLTGGKAGRQTYGRDGQPVGVRTGYRLIDSV